MHKLCDKMKSELEMLEQKVEKTGKLSCQEIQYVNVLTNSLLNLDKIKSEHYPEEMEKYGDYSKDYVSEWIGVMENESGERGAYWTKAETTDVAKNNGITFDTITEDDWYLTMNMIYSDHSQIAKKYGVDSISYYVDLAKQWLWDSDTKQGKCKLMSYYKNIVKRY